jgi:uncharacterized protein YqeY
MVGTNAGNREVTDADVVQVLRKIEKGLLETIKLYIVELGIVMHYLPVPLSDEEVTRDIQAIMATLNLLGHRVHWAKSPRR